MRATPSIRQLASALALGALALAGCDKPAVVPGLDITCRPQDPTCQPGRISGNVVYQGKKRGDVILLLFKSSMLPPPDGLGTSAASLTRVSKERMFGGDRDGTGPFAAPFVFTQVPPDTYQIRAFLDTNGTFVPFFDYAQQPRSGDVAGGHVSVDAQGVPHFLDVTVASGGDVANVPVALGLELPFDPPVFTVANAVDNKVSIPASFDRPVTLKLESSKLRGAGLPTMENAKFAVELKLDAKGLPAISDGDGFFDSYPQVILRQVDQVNEDGTRSAVNALNAAVVPAKVNTLPLLPLLMKAPTQAVGTSQLEISILPFAGHLVPDKSGPVFQPISAVPAGSYQLVVIERTGQVWTMPNSLAASVASQGTTFEFTTGTLPSGRLRGNINYQGTAKPGNILVQAYRADSANPPPPLGTQLPVRVKIIRAAAVTKATGGFSASYQLDGLVAGKYVVAALSDGDGNFASFNLLQTPTKGDLLGGHLDTLGHLKVVDVTTGPIDGIDVTLVAPPGGDPVNGGGLDAPAFEIDETAAPAQIAQDARGVARFTVKAKPVAFPIGAGAADTTKFTVALVRDGAGKTVDSDGDGLPDVWPRAFLVQLDDNDTTLLTQKAPTTVLPAAVDPTPFLPRLVASDTPVLASQLSIIVRPAALDASNPAALKQLPVMPAGRYKVVLMNKTGQLWQVPNESGTAALDPRAAAVSAATASQSKAFRVLPAGTPAPTGAVTGKLRVVLPSGVTSFAGAYVFATDARNPPPPVGTGKPISVDYHSFAEFSTSDVSVSYTLRALPPGDYYVTAVADVRGDFALEPQLFAAAAGEGTLTGGKLNSSGTALETVTVAGSAITADVVVGRALPSRPSFVVLGAGDLPVTSDLGVSAPFFPDALKAQRISIAATPVLNGTVAPKAEATAPQFPISFQSCATSARATDSDFDNVPDVYPRVLVVKLADSDPTGMTLDPVTTVIPAAVDPTEHLTDLGDCGLRRVKMASRLSVLLSPIAVQPDADGRLVQVPVPAGRYGIVLMSSTGQTWRIPNEVQPALLDASVAASTRASLATQGVAIRIGAQVPAAQPGGIAGTVRLNGYAGATVGNVIVAAYLATAPPPPLGLGRPVAVQVIPRTYVTQAAAAGVLPYKLSNVPAGAYLVAALHDPGSRVSPVLSYMAGPSLGTQVAFSGGAVPSVVVVGSTVSTGNDVTLDATATTPIPFERPMFALNPASQISVSSGATAGTAAVVQIDAAIPTGLAHAPPSSAAFHPIPARDGAGLPYRVPSADTNQPNCGANRPWASTQVYVTPIDTGSPLVPYVSLNQCQFCTALTGTADCSANPLAVPATMPAIGFGITNLAVNPVTKALAGVPLPTGHYAITVVEPTGLVWTVPNELAAAAAPSGPQQSFVFTVVP